MNNVSYKIVISLSHRRIAYEYWLQDGENGFKPMPGGVWPAPLAFYCSNRGIIIGADAARAAQSGVTNAFNNYFEILDTDTTYSIGGKVFPIRNLLLDASETLFNDFYKRTLFNSRGSLIDNRAEMPLTIICESDIESHEKAFLKRLFKDSGYGRVQTKEYNKLIARYIKESLSKEYSCDTVIVVWTEGVNLTFTLFDANKDNPVSQKTYPGLGIDPRKDFVETLIWDRVRNQNPFLIREQEQDAISKAAADFLSSSAPMIDSTLLLSDGNSYHYTLMRNSIDNIPGYNGVSIKDSLDGFLKENNATDRGRILVLLRGDAANNTYFANNIGSGFLDVIKSDRELRDNIMRLILLEKPFVPEPDNGPVDPIIYPTHNPLKELRKKWRIVKAEANGKERSGLIENAIQILEVFLSECDGVAGSEPLRTEVSTEIKRLKGTLTPDVDSKEIKRKWRRVKAEANGKERSDRPDEAIKLVKAFAKEASASNAPKDVIDDINALLLRLKELVQKGINASNPNAQPSQKNTASGTKQKAPGSTPKINVDKHDPSKEEHQGQELIRKGELKKARDWYRENGDSKIAKLLSDIIRMQKGVELRKSSIEDCRKSKNQTQIKRIIEELQQYIDLCAKVGIDIAEYKRLLSDYKRIK